MAFCKGFNLNKGAFASSIAHDSHNIIAIGCSDLELSKATIQSLCTREALRYVTLIK